MITCKTLNGEVVIPGKLTLALELVLSELVSKNPKCKHRNDEDKFTIMLTDREYKCGICGESHDKLADFFIDNMAQGQLKEEENK